MLMDSEVATPKEKKIFCSIYIFIFNFHIKCWLQYNGVSWALPKMRLFLFALIQMKQMKNNIFCCKLRFQTNLYINMILNLWKGMGKFVQSILCSTIFSNVFLDKMVSMSNQMVLNKDTNSFINFPSIVIELQFQVLLLTHLIEFCHWMVLQFI